MPRIFLRGIKEPVQVDEEFSQLVQTAIQMHQSKPFTYKTSIFNSDEVKAITPDSAESGQHDEYEKRRQRDEQSALIRKRAWQKELYKISQMSHEQKISMSYNIIFVNFWTIIFGYEPIPEQIKKRALVTIGQYYRSNPKSAYVTWLEIGDIFKRYHTEKPKMTGVGERSIRAYIATIANANRDVQNIGQVDMRQQTTADKISFEEVKTLFT